MDYPGSKKIWIDFAKDTILLHDDYLWPETNSIVVPPYCPCHSSPEDLGPFERELVQNVAIHAEQFRFCGDDLRAQKLQEEVEEVLEHFIAIKKLYIVHEDGIDPFSRGRIRFFPMERNCLSTCDNKGCIHLATIAANFQESIDKLRASKVVLAKAVDVRMSAHGGVARGRTMDMLLMAMNLSLATTIIIRR